MRMQPMHPHFYLSRIQLDYAGARLISQGRGDIVLTECNECSARAYDEALPDALTSAKHCRLFSSYLFNLERGPIAVREMIVGDIVRLRDLGARQLATDLSLVLDCFLANFPEARSPDLCECARAAGQHA